MSVLSRAFLPLPMPARFLHPAPLHLLLLQADVVVEFTVSKKTVNAVVGTPLSQLCAKNKVKVSLSDNQQTKCINTLPKPMQRHCCLLQFYFHEEDASAVRSISDVNITAVATHLCSYQVYNFVRYLDSECYDGLFVS